MNVNGAGNTQARIMIVGEAPGENEMREGKPFVGPSGAELNKMLHEAGISRSDCWVTNVCRQRPPDNDLKEWLSTNKHQPKEHPDWTNLDGLWVDPRVREGLLTLEKEVSLIRPNVIIALGNLAMWALTRKWGITSWRGSVLGGSPGPVVVPSIHPAAVLRSWDLRGLVVQDFRRAKKYEFSREVIRPNYAFIIRPIFAQVWRVLCDLERRLDAGEELWLGCDIETRSGHIACIGIAWSRLDALCIPLMDVNKPEGYWSEGEELAIVDKLRSVLTRAKVTNQNWLYDAQYFWRWLRFMPNWQFDTMIGHHVIFPGTAKDLGQLSSIYCDFHEYWKDDGREWHLRAMGEDGLWRYNCIDCVVAYELREKLEPLPAQVGLEGPATFQQHVATWLCLDMMIRGIRRDRDATSKLSVELLEELTVREMWINEVAGHQLNPSSPKQMMEFFYTDLRQPVQWTRKPPRRPTLDDDALKVIARKEPILRPLVRKINEFRSIRVFRSTFIEARADTDGRIRSSFNPGGPETFRLSSGTSAFWNGMNMQNIPMGGLDGDDPEFLELPNVRKIFIPDPGYVIADMDLDRADLQVVVWEADDEELREALKSGLDIHSLNAKALYNLSCSVGDVKKLHPLKRQTAKNWVHGTNYGGGPRTMAVTAGITIHEAEKMQARWFQIHPGIKSWHERTEASLRSTRSVSNRFGYRRFYFDRVDGLLPEALAWVPQSTVACVINRIWAEIVTTLPEVQLLVQVHDSLVTQFPAAKPELAQACLDCARRVVIPYEKPLVIPASINVSSKSWGDCKS